MGCFLNMRAEQQHTHTLPFDPSRRYRPKYASFHAKQRLSERNGLWLRSDQWELIVQQAIEGKLPIHKRSGELPTFMVTMPDEDGGFWQIPMVINTDLAFVVTVLPGRYYTRFAPEVSSLFVA